MSIDNLSFQRVELMVGNDSFKRLQSARVIIFGVGGVGSWCAESLARTGIGSLTIVDCDRIEQTNINRQLPATVQTVDKVKVNVMAERLRSINPEAEIIALREYYSEETAGKFNLDEYTFVVDAIDTLTDKALLILNATRADTKLVSSMGAALKMDPTKISISEFWKVQGCPLAAALRRKFKKTGNFPSRKFMAVYSPEIYHNRGEQPTKKEKPQNPADSIGNIDPNAKKAIINGTVAHTTAIFGFMLAGLVVEEICKQK